MEFQDGRLILDTGGIVNEDYKKMRRGKVSDIGDGTIYFFDVEQGSKTFGSTFGKIEGFRGQPLKELGIKVGTVVKFVSNDDEKVDSIAL